MSTGIRIYSPAYSAGYGYAAIPYVRGLVNAGVPVHWTPISDPSPNATPLNSAAKAKLIEATDQSTALNDLAALFRATETPIDCNAVFVHTMPEAWDRYFEPGKLNVGYTTWETDQLPTHWPHLLKQAHVICVPCEHNLRVFAAEVTGRPIHVVPHIRRHAWQRASSDAIKEFKSSLGIPEDHFVFYSIGTWEPRKNFESLLRAFTTAFNADHKVTLLVKTSPIGSGPAPLYARQNTHTLVSDVMAELEQTLGRPLPNICVLPYELSEAGIDMLHQIGHCYVSLSHGEGWGMGAFDAATLGNPVVMTKWGGQLDFLGDDWPGAVTARLGPAPVWPPYQPSFWPSQNWAYPDVSVAVERLRTAVDSPQTMQNAARSIQQQITNRFSEYLVIRQLKEALGV